MDLPTCSPRSYTNCAQLPHFKSFRGSTPYMQSSSFPNNRAPHFNSSYHYHHWQIPHVEYITDVKPDDGKYW